MSILYILWMVLKHFALDIHWSTKHDLQDANDHLLLELRMNFKCIYSTTTKIIWVFEQTDQITINSSRKKKTRLSERIANINLSMSPFSLLEFKMQNAFVYWKLFVHTREMLMKASMSKPLITVHVGALKCTWDPVELFMVTRIFHIISV